MKKLPLVAAAFVGATPAHATSGLICSTAGPSRTEVAMVIGHSAVSSVVSARLSERGTNVPVTIAQSWLERNEVRLDLTDRDAARLELRLRAKRNGRSYDGSIWRAGQRRWIRCRES